MEQKIILACVIIISLIAHVWIYRWIKFKMDEGAILRHLKDLELECLHNQSVSTADNISEAIMMKKSRVVFVAEKSTAIVSENSTYQLISGLEI
tara:strand:+ start:451 stop:732 length:282 start_codon:yes stop_codon:yes gene_type:complete